MAIHLVCHHLYPPTTTTSAIRGFRFAPNRRVDDDQSAAGRAGSEAAPPRSAAAKDEGALGV